MLNLHAVDAVDRPPPDTEDSDELWREQHVTPEDISTLTGVGRDTVTSRPRHAMDKPRGWLAP